MKDDIVFQGSSHSYPELIRAILFLANQENFNGAGALNFKLPVISTLFPFKVVEINKNRAELKFLEQFFKLFPYLLRPQRVYNFSTEFHIGTKYLFSLDKLIRRDRLNGNFLVQIARDKALADVNLDTFTTVVSSSEYLVNLNGLVRAIRNLYAEINISMVGWGQDSKTSDGLAIEIDPKGNQPGHFYYYDKVYQFHVLKIEGRSFFVPYSIRGEISVLMSILNDLGFIVDDSKFRCLFKEQNTILPSSSFNLYQAVKELNSAEGFSMGKLKRFIQDNASDQRIEGNYNRVFDWCDEYFDEAKQTGISYSKFQELFFIYGPEIQQMTEKAYELMNETRDVDVIWEKVVKEVS